MIETQPSFIMEDFKVAFKVWENDSFVSMFFYNPSMFKETQEM